MNLKQHARLNVFVTPTEQPKATDPELGSQPSWGADSEENTRSWWEVFEEMGKETAEIRARMHVKEPLELEEAMPAKPKPKAKPIAMPVDAWVNRSGDEVVLLLADDTSLLMPVRRIHDTQTYHTLAVRQEVWNVYRAAKEQMKRLGFRAMKENGVWQFQFRAIAKPDADKSLPPEDSPEADIWEREAQAVREAWENDQVPF